jgi:hypothetical protein
VCDISALQRQSNAVFPVSEITLFSKSHNRPRVLVLWSQGLVLLDYIEVVVVRGADVLGLFAPFSVPIQ